MSACHPFSDTEASPFIGRLDGAALSTSFQSCPLALSRSGKRPLQPSSAAASRSCRLADRRPPPHGGSGGPGQPRPFPRATRTSCRPIPERASKPVGNGRSLAHAIKVTRATRPNRRGMLPLPAHRQGQVGKLVPPGRPGTPAGCLPSRAAPCDASPPSRSVGRDAHASSSCAGQGQSRGPSRGPFHPRPRRALRPIGPLSGREAPGRARESLRASTDRPAIREHRPAAGRMVGFACDPGRGRKELLQVTSPSRRVVSGPVTGNRGPAENRLDPPAKAGSGFRLGRPDWLQASQDGSSIDLTDRQRADFGKGIGVQGAAPLGTVPFVSEGVQLGARAFFNSFAKPHPLASASISRAFAALRSSTGSMPRSTLSRACASVTVGKPPSPISRRRPPTSMRRIQVLPPFGVSCRYRPATPPTGTMALPLPPGWASRLTSSGQAPWRPLAGPFTYPSKVSRHATTHRNGMKR